MYIFSEVSIEDELGLKLQQLVEDEAGEFPDFSSFSHEFFFAPTMVLVLRYFPKYRTKNEVRLKSHPSSH
jgi:hypothetical protein